jgi:pantoate--beta-alanine ligase
MQELSAKLRSCGKTIVLVPTMGFLHEGHLFLMELGRKSGDVLVATIFVNPTQFGPNEDFSSYPRDLEKDTALCRSVGVDILFVPEASDLYGTGYQTFIDLEFLPNHLCGLSRPGHFRGVATVVTKLFHITRPNRAIFGQKDFQQVQVIRRMVRDLDMDVEILVAPTVREPDGLAKSSRNTYLTPEQRPAALSLYRSLEQSRKMAGSGIRNVKTIVKAAKTLIQSFSETRIDYISVCHPDTLEQVDDITGPVLMALAVRVGKTRLIDNMILEPESAETAG